MDTVVLYPYVDPLGNYNFQIDYANYDPSNPPPIILNLSILARFFHWEFEKVLAGESGLESFEAYERWVACLKWLADQGFFHEDLLSDKLAREWSSRRLAEIKSQRSEVQSGE